jgi:diguanylate cyclase (GGDEF)-like protein/PAS domain S-box-containing protein
MKDGRPTVLIIDDSPEDVETFRHYLRDAFEVLATDRGDRGLALASATPPDCLLLDYQLPDMTGLEFLTERGTGHDEDYAIIILTGHADVALAVECMKHGAHDFLTKGRITPDALQRAIVNGLEKVAMRRQAQAQQREIERSLALLEELNRTLERRVARRTHELSVTNAELKRTERSLRASEDRYRHVVEDQTEMICRYQADGTILYINEAASHLFGKPPEALIGQPWPAETGPEELPFIHGNLKLLSSAHPMITFENRFRTAAGVIRWGQFVNRAFYDEEDRLLETQSIGRDITERKALEIQLATIAYHDILTNLPNRLLIADRLNQMLAQAERSGRALAVCYLDLDGFKPVNDTFGHAAGDQLLKAIATRMQVTIRANDSVGRLGGDEFVLLLSELTDLDECRHVLQRVIDAIDQPVLVDEQHQVTVGASIGVALFPSDSLDPDTLLRYADLAMYQAKKQGRHRVSFFTAGQPVA